MRRSNEILILVAILLIGALIRGLYLTEMAHTPDFTYPGVDPAYHDYWARSLATGNWAQHQPFPDPRIQVTPFFRPPGYPYFLALIYFLTGGNYLAARIVQMAIGLLSAFMAYKLGRRWLGSASGLIAAGLMAFYWVFIYYEGELLEPVLLLPLGLGLIYQLSLLTEKATWPRSLAAGVLLGLFALCRPNVLLFGLAAVIWIWWQAGNRRLALNASVALMLGAVLTISPATIRNYVVAHDFVPISSNMGINLWMGNNETATGLCRPDIADLGRFGTCFEYPSIVANMEQRVGRPLKYSEASDYLSQLATEYIKGHPVETLSVMLRKAEYFWSPREVGHNEEDELERLNSRVLSKVPGRFALVLGFGLIGAAMLFADSWRKKDAALQKRYAVLVLMLLFVAGYFVSFLPFFSAGQYRIPIIPFLMLFAGYGIGRIGQLAVGRKYIPAACRLLACLGAFGLASINLTGYQPDASKWHYDRALDFKRIGKYDLAVTEYKEAIRIKPWLGQAHSNLGLLLLDMGRTDEAMSQFEQALKINPDDYWAPYGMGMILANQGKLREASDQFERAIYAYPGHFMAHHELGLIMLAMHNVEAAEAHFLAALRINPDFSPSHVGMTMIMESRGKPNEAADHLRAALRAAPDADLYFRLAGILVNENKLDEALECYSQAVRLKPDNPIMRYNLGVALERKRELKEAIAQYREAIRLQPKYAKAHRNLAVALYLKGDYAGAWREVRECRKYGVALHPDFLKALAQKMPEPK